MPLSNRGKAPLTGPPKFGGLPSRRLGGCTLVQAENELKGKLIPGGSGAAHEETNCTFDDKFSWQKMSSVPPSGEAPPKAVKGAYYRKNAK